MITKLLAILTLWGASSFAQAVEGSVVNSATGEGISGVEVKILKGATVLFTRYTDANGAFTVQDLADGDYAAVYSPFDYSPNLTDSRPAFAAQVVGPAQPFQIGGRPDAVKLEARMIPFGRLAGRVINGRGEPAPGALLQLSGSQLGSQLMMLISADDHGNFELKVRPGSYKLSATPVGHLKPPNPDPENGQPQGWARTYYPGVAFEEIASEILMQPGVDATGIEIKLVAAPAHAIRGVTLYPDGKPAPKVILHLGADFPSLQPPQYTQSGEDGAFRFEGVIDGVHEITADFQAGDVDFRAREPVEVVGHDLDRVNVILSAPFTVTGKVIIEAQDGTPAPKPPGLVSLDEVDHRAHSQVFKRGQWANPDAQGNFRVTHVYPGTYIVSTGSSDARPGAAEGFASAPPGYFLDSIRAGDVELPDRVVRLTVPVPIALVYKNNGGTVRGGLEHCALGAVWLFPRDATHWHRDFFRSATCDASDHFEIADVRAGEYYALALSAVNPSPFEDGVFDETLLAQAVPVTVRAGEAVSPDLHLLIRSAF
jgi:hypothetical protein